MKKDLDEETEEAKAARGTLYYDFTPYNSKDPVLLSLMTAKQEDPWRFTQLTKLNAYIQL